MVNTVCYVLLLCLLYACVVIWPSVLNCDKMFQEKQTLQSPELCQFVHILLLEYLWLCIALGVKMLTNKLLGFAKVRAQTFVFSEAKMQRRSWHRDSAGKLIWVKAVEP